MYHYSIPLDLRGMVEGKSSVAEIQKQLQDIVDLESPSLSQRIKIHLDDGWATDYDLVYQGGEFYLWAHPVVGCNYLLRKVRKEADAARRINGYQMTYHVNTEEGGVSQFFYEGYLDGADLPPVAVADVDYTKEEPPKEPLFDGQSGALLYHLMAAIRRQYGRQHAVQ